MSFSRETGLRPQRGDAAAVEEQRQNFGYFRGAEERERIFRALQQKLVERRQRSVALQEKAKP